MKLFNSPGLFLKLFAPMGLIFIVVCIVLSTYVPATIRDNVIASALPTATNTVQQYKIVRGYYTSNVVKKVLVGSSMKAHFEHKDNANQIPLPATFIHELSEEFSALGMVLKLYSKYPFPNREDRSLDGFGQDAWQQLNNDPSQTYSRVEEVDGKDVVRVAVADTMVAQGCVDCHNSHPDTPKTGWKLGDVRGVLEVQVPISEQLAAGKQLQYKITLLVILALLISAIALMVLFRRLVSSRLDEVSSAMRNIAEGDGNLNQRLNSGADDEVGAIVSAFNIFMEQMANSLRGIGLEIGQLVSTSRILEDISENSQQGAFRQQQETDQVAAAMNEMTATAQEVANLAANTAHSAEQTQNDAESGREVVKENMQAVEELSEEIQRAVDVVGQLESDSQSIGGVLDVIRGIAEQTNLLALNAAIEAARAGEQGRGFAVVADEVRTLASRTQSSTEEIQQMIVQLQNGAKEAVTSIEQGNQSLQRSLEKADQTREVIESIAESIVNIHNLNIQIATAAEEQTSASDEINRNITGIADVANDNSESAQQLQNSAGEISQAIDSVNQQLQRFTGKD